MRNTDNLYSLVPFSLSRQLFCILEASRKFAVTKSMLSEIALSVKKKKKHKSPTKLHRRDRDSAN